MLDTVGMVLVSTAFLVYFSLLCKTNYFAAFICASKHSHLAIDGHRPLKDAMHAQNGRLWGIDDRCAKQGAEHTAVADGEGASIHILHSKLIFSSLGHITRISPYL